jgi:hypothetical protein
VADYIRFRFTAAKVGVSMAFLALLAGVAEKVRSGTPHVSATNSALYIKLGGITGEVKQAFLKIEDVFVKLDKVLVGLDHKLLQNYYTRHKIDATFLKITDANQKFLKITAANANFLKIDGTAANANKLGGLTPESFVQGHADVVSGGILIGLDQPSAMPLLQTPDGKLALSVQSNSDQVVLNFANNTGGTLDAVRQDVTSNAAGNAVSTQLKAGVTQIGLPGHTHQLHLQVFPGSGLNEALTLTLSTDFSSANQSQVEVVGQLLIGLL